MAFLQVVPSTFTSIFFFFGWLNLAPTKRASLTLDLNEVCYGNSFHLCSASSTSQAQGQALDMHLLGTASQPPVNGIPLLGVPFSRGRD